MYYVMNSRQYWFYKQQLGMTDAEILGEVNRARGLRGSFKRIKLEG